MKHSTADLQLAAAVQARAFGIRIAAGKSMDDAEYAALCAKPLRPFIEAAFKEFEDIAAVISELQGR